MINIFLRTQLHECLLNIQYFYGEFRQDNRPIRGKRGRMRSRSTGSKIVLVDNIIVHIGNKKKEPEKLLSVQIKVYWKAIVFYFMVTNKNKTNHLLNYELMIISSQNCVRPIRRKLETLKRMRFQEIHFKIPIF